MKQSRRQKEIEARKAADPIAQALGRTDIDYESDDLPTAPRMNRPVTGIGADAEPTFRDSEYLAFIRPSRPGLVPLQPAPRQVFEVWAEGWSATGNNSPARLVAKVEALTFREACYVAMCREYLDGVASQRKSATYYNPDRFDYDFTNLKIWGCRLFPSEIEARASFG